MNEVNKQFEIYSKRIPKRMLVQMKCMSKKVYKYSISDLFFHSVSSRWHENNMVFEQDNEEYGRILDQLENKLTVSKEKEKQLL